MEMECFVLPAITVPIPQKKIEANEIVLPKDVQLAYNKPGEINLLIGAGPYWKILIGSPKNRINGQPALQNTKLGWIIGRELYNTKVNATDQSTSCLAITNDQLHQQVEKFWKIEGFPEVRHYTKEEKICVKHFVEATSRKGWQIHSKAAATF